MFFKSAAVALFSALAVKAATFTVQVGAGGLVFAPDQITGVVAGDDVEFQFMAKNHTVTQSTFGEPCKAMDGGVNSGFLAISDGLDLSAGQPTWTFTVQDDTAPLWFYCRQKTPVAHCGKGMVFSLNPTAEKSHEAFVATALATDEAAPVEAASALSDSNGAGRAVTGSAATLLAVAGVISALL